MKVVQINTVPTGSTGTIMMNIHKELINSGNDSYVVWGRGRKANDKHEIYMNNKIGIYFHALYTRITGKTGFASKRSTKELIKKLKKINPDIVHLHNIHGYYINIEILFKYLKDENVKVVWTLHDCWSFTGQCPHFDICKCNKWKTGCFDCPMISEYPKTIKDNSRFNYLKKKQIFNSVALNIITPSNWLANLVKTSFLKDNRVQVINNGIDTSVFKYKNSQFKKNYNLENKKIILGVASVWDTRKGLNDFFELSKQIDEKYVIVLIGLSKKQIKHLPSNIIGISKTENQIQLSEIYSCADIFINPTYEDNYPTTNLEAVSCGTPVITYDTGGSPEILLDDLSKGLIVKKENNFFDIRNVNNLNKAINKIKDLKVSKDKITKIDKNKMIKEYIDLYSDIVGE